MVGGMHIVHQALGLIWIFISCGCVTFTVQQVLFSERNFGFFSQRYRDIKAERRKHGR